MRPTKKAILDLFQAAGPEALFTIEQINDHLDSEGRPTSSTSYHLMGLVSVYRALEQLGAGASAAYRLRLPDNDPPVKILPVFSLAPTPLLPTTQRVKDPAAAPGCPLCSQTDLVINSGANHYYCRACRHPFRVTP